MRILQISTYEKGGGAEAIAWQLFDQYRQRGHHSLLAVGEKSSDDPQVIPLSHVEQEKAVNASLTHLDNWLAPYEGRIRGVWRMRHWLQTYVAQPNNWWQARLGRENFNFPESWRLFDLMQDRPDILHCHNLHGGWLPRGGYFDLSALPWLSREIPTVMTLHDTWMLSGHCAYTLGCDRWKTGCGHCPDLSIYPAIARDATAANWKRKRDIYTESRVYVATPSRWLMRQVEQSILAPAVVEGRVIPNGVDSTVYKPGSRRQAREALGLSQQDMMLLFVANAARSNVFKDYRTIEQCARQVTAQYSNSRITVIVLGDQGDPILYKNGGIQFVPFQRDKRITAQYYQATDVYVHAAKSDTFPNTVLEALACGRPVVATAIDGIPEQIEEGRSGFLVSAGDADAMTGRVIQLLSNEPLRTSMGTTAAAIASRSFGIHRQVQSYLGWYEQILSSSQLSGRNAHAC
ncbi:MAG: glycosyltransferase [Nitrospira sp.]|nr:glycosyltransferase [Nitrospira sp.]